MEERQNIYKLKITIKLAFLSLFIIEHHLRVVKMMSSEANT
jgi:hypothetical protein